MTYEGNTITAPFNHAEGDWTVAANGTPIGTVRIEGDSMVVSKDGKEIGTVPMFADAVALLHNG